MKSMQFLFCFLLVSVSINVEAQKTSKKNISKPNIIFILADDLGIGNVSCYGADSFYTPNIDKLAKEGIQFNHAYTAPLCGPSRALIMTGRYAFRTGATNQDATALIKPSVEIMMPDVLKPAGYITTCVGKWGQLPLGPAEFGFDDYLRFKGSGLYKSSPEKSEHYTVNGADKILKIEEYFPDIIHEHLIDFIIANKDKPFYAYYSMTNVHAKILPTPDSKPDSRNLFADNVTYMDKLVGKLIHTLDSLKLRDNTLIVFFGDNGTSSPWCFNSPVNGKKLSGKKGEMKECGSLVPMIANWPGKIASGVMSDQLIDGSDFLPTFAEIAGAKLPTKNVIDGQSFAPQLLGKKGKEREWIFVELGNKWYARNKEWKLNREGELFNMTNAPFEENLITADQKNAQSESAQKTLQIVLDKLAPQNGILDTGNGNGRHANKNKDKKADKDKDSEKEPE